jgi:predicted O-linked N-acetylglucosamine transferase (SPINDLY family)
MPGISQDSIYHQAVQWNDKYAKNLHKNNLKLNNTRDKDRRLRIGYVSPDFREHSVNYFFEPVLMAHDNNNFEIYCYANVKKPDDVTRRLQAAAGHWTSIVNLDDAEAAELIRKDRIDILVDLAGHTKDNRLLVFGYRPAPVQVTWLGYPNTTGMQSLDYRLTDEIADPAGTADNLHSEKLVRLEPGFLCYKPYEPAPDVSPLPCTKTGNTTFGSFNSLIKITPEVVKLWSKILHTIPLSRLLLKSSRLTDQQHKERCLEMFADERIEPGRLELCEWQKNKEDHLKLYDKIDIGLDPFPYNGTTTTFEALWMGVPVVTMLGDMHAGRVGASIMNQVGLGELVADTAENYVKLVVSLAKKYDRLAVLRSGLREQMRNSGIMDSKLFTEKLENEYRKMWIKWCEQEAN